MNDAKVTWMRERYGDSLVQYGGTWTERATRTTPIQPETIVPAIEALYGAANLDRPRVVIVPSPGVMAFAGTFAAAVWEKRKTNPEYDPIQRLSDVGSVFHRSAAEAVVKATQSPTNVSLSNDVGTATLEATYSPADLATVNALETNRWRDIREAMQEFNALLYADECVRGAMRDPFGNNKLTEMMAWAMQDWGQVLATDMFSSKDDAQFALGKVADWWQHSQAGNTALYWTSCIAAARDVDGLQLAEHQRFSLWEQSTIECSYRYMHPNFCIVCDFPEMIDKESIVSSYEVRKRSLRESQIAPSYRWRDGWFF